MKESGKERLKSTIYESTLSTADAVPLPQGGRLRGAALCADFCKRRCPKVVTSHSKPLIPAFKLRGSTGSEGSKGSGGGFAAILADGIPVSSAFPSRGRCPEGADRALAV